MASTRLSLHALCRAAFLVANRVAEQTAEQTNVVPQRTVRLVVEIQGYEWSLRAGSVTSGTSSCTSRSNGKSAPAIGFGLGIERLLLLLSTDRFLGIWLEVDAEESLDEAGVKHATFDGVVGRKRVTSGGSSSRAARRRRRG